MNPTIRNSAAISVALAITVLLLAGCTGSQRPSSSNGTTPNSTAATIPPGKSTQTITVDGTVRTFHLYRPSTLDTSKPVPLVIMLHGGYGSGTQAESSYGWDPVADKNNFLVVYPDGENHAWSAGGGCCGKPGEDNVNDVAFLTNMVTTIRGEISIDPARIFATGMSNGAIMDYLLACDTNIFAAIGPVSGTQLGPCPNPKPISDIEIHGTTDEHIPYNGGVGDEGTQHIDGPSIPAVNAMWRSVDSCAAPTMTTSGAVTTSIAQCPDARSVEQITVAGAGHQWPGAPDRPIIQAILHTDPPSTALNATDTIWRFFASHPKANH